MSTHNFKEFVCSSPVFNGFRCKIDLNYCNDLRDITKSFKENLLEVLIKNNFDTLISKVNESKICINSYHFNDILISNNDEIFIINIIANI